MFTKRSLFAFLSFLLVFGLSVSLSAAQEEVAVAWLTHWGEERLLEAQEAIIAEYEAATPGVNIELRTVPFDQLLTTIITGRTAGTNADVYHFYNLWMPEFVGSGLLAVPPEDVVENVTTTAAPAAVQGTIVNGQVWGTPTEINTYLLLYNKRLLEEAGFSEPPANWDELKEIAAAITQQDDTGAVTQVGFGVLSGWDSGVVHPFTSLLYSNGGNYLSDDFSATAFNSPQGQETLQLYVDLLANGGMDLSVAGLTEFPNGKVGMIIMANWWRATLQAAEAIDYETEVGVAPIPTGPSGDDSYTLSYNWLLGVDANSPNQEAAWAFIRWLNTPRAEGEGSPMGDYLVHDLGAIPSFTFDQEAFADDLSDHFLSPFVASTVYARPEPVVSGGQEIKTRLQTEIEGVWTGLSDPLTALEIAASEGDTILAEMAQGGE